MITKYENKAVKPRIIKQPEPKSQAVKIHKPKEPKKVSK
jgi:hypothetical protein